MSSINFKLHVVAEYQAGASLKMLQKKYDIRSSDMITEWVDRYSDCLPKHLYNEAHGASSQYQLLQQQQQKLRELKQRVTRLEEIMQNRANIKHMTDFNITNVGYTVGKK